MPCCAYCHQPLVAPPQAARPVLGKQEDRTPIYVAAGLGGLFVVFLIVLALQSGGSRTPKPSSRDEGAVRTMMPRSDHEEAPARGSGNPSKTAPEPATPPRSESSTTAAANPPAAGANPPLSSAQPPAAPSPSLSSPAASGDTAASVAGADALLGLRYDRKEGDKHAYEFAITIEASDRVLEVRGMDFLTVKSTHATLLTREQQVNGSATGFVVRSDGLLVTCAHVVEDATKIEAHIGGKKYPVRVVSIDKQHDLAVVRIDAAGLPVLELADSDKVSLAENVRAVGYPFCSMLGNSVKVTVGTVGDPRE